MSALSDIADEYLALRRSFGHDLVEAHRLLPRFVAYLDSVGEPTVTVAAALAWAQAPDVSPTGRWGPEGSPATWPPSTSAPKSHRPV